MEKCVLCHKTLNVSKNTPINKRSYYVTGAGQLCEYCYKKLYRSK